MKLNKARLWALIGFVHGLIVTFRLPQKSVIAFVVSGLLWALVWLVASWLIIRLMSSKYRKPIGIFSLVSGVLILVGNRTISDPTMDFLAFLQLIASAVLLLPQILKARKGRQLRSGEENEQSK